MRFNFKCEGGSVPAFAIRHRGKVYAYLNRCAHVGLELDWIEGEFFNDLGLYLICSTHGATYTPDIGLCMADRAKARAWSGLPWRKKTAGLLVNKRGLKHGG